MTQGPIEFFFEFGSPYGYFAANQIEEIAKEAGRELIWHPYMLGPAFKKTGAVPLRDVPLKGPYCLHDWQRISQYTGIDFQLPEKFPAAILAAPRGFYWLADQGKMDKAVEFAKAAYRAYFAEGRAMWTNEETAKVAQECAIDGDAFLAAVQDPAVKKRLFDAAEYALERGVFGSPFFLVDGEALWGWDRLTMLKDWLKKGTW